MLLRPVMKPGIVEWGGGGTERGGGAEGGVHRVVKVVAGVR